MQNIASYNILLGAYLKNDDFVGFDGVVNDFILGLLDVQNIIPFGLFDPFCLMV